VFRVGPAHSLNLKGYVLF